MHLEEWSAGLSSEGIYQKARFFLALSTTVAIARSDGLLERCVVAPMTAVLSHKIAVLLGAKKAAKNNA